MTSIQETMIFVQHHTGNVIFNQGDDGDSNVGSQIFSEHYGNVGNKDLPCDIDVFFQLLGREEVGQSFQSPCLISGSNGAIMDTFMVLEYLQNIIFQFKNPFSLTKSTLNINDGTSGSPLILT